MSRKRKRVFLGVSFKIMLGLLLNTILAANRQYGLQILKISSAYLLPINIVAFENSHNETVNFRNESTFADRPLIKTRKSNMAIRIKKSKYIILAVFALLFVFAVVVLGQKMKIGPESKVAATVSPTPTATIDTTVGSDFTKFGLKIDKLDLLAPIVEDVDGENKNAYNKALQGGVAHYKGTALPGEKSNIFIFGHSSTVTGQGPYAKIFASLGDLEKGDEIIVFYKDKEYRYSVFDKQVVEKDETSVLDPTKKEQLTLMTCWPVGTNAKRMIIKASIAKD